MCLGRPVCVCVCVLTMMVALEQDGAPVESQTDRTNSTAASGADKVARRRGFHGDELNIVGAATAQIKVLNAVIGWTHVRRSSIHPDALRDVEVTLKAGHYWNCSAVSRYSGTSP